MSTAIATIPELPSYLQVGSEAARARNLAAMGGIKAGGFPRISIGGAKFHLIDGDDKILLTDPNNRELPAMQLEVSVVGFNPGVSKTYYKGKWQEGDADEPDCSSDDGITPDPHVAAPQCTNCAGCPQNQWGSKISEQGKQIKACSDNKRLVILPVSDLDASKAIAFTITPASLKPWAEYVRALDSRGVEISTCVTKIQFDPTVTFPKLQFKFGRYLTPEELAIVRERETEDDVRLIASPRKSAPQSPRAAAPAAPAQPATVAPAPSAPVAPTAPAAAPPPAPAEVKPEWKAGLTDQIAAAIEAVGGPDSPGGAALMAQFKPKQEPAPEPKAADPYEGLPAHVKPAVDAAGGIDSDAGKSVYVALSGRPLATPPAGQPAAEAPAKRRGRPAAKPAETPAQAPVAQPATTVAPAATPAAPAASFANAAPAPGDLEALLRNAMQTPTA
jgi:hypothetical protein